ncbi:uncharacterized protein BXZ73DRAFT_39180 [Epithele typhae]|uniref:uncharacterized protein n=1 Tax=Epithele typhae TaxID=378194 RepID=UPI0020084679|nr:uncharacterized protein BXZ73DRAFT_39180 [Epithele typhae]KAH9944094.1 hypothetical protein BXZ73DRAFT_39180 [Epithele typhae]
MTAVLQATDILRKDRGMASMDDSAINAFSSSGTDWKTKYMEVADMLAETRAELDDFHHSSKELEEELERELERTEKAHQDLKVKVARAETERDDWKSKFMSFQTTHNTTTTSLQRELDTLRQEHQRIKIQLRELEMGNDDLERNERAISSSLADVEQKYARALEEKILLEHELLDKANVEEESQRMKDELRDANEEIAILKDQLASAQQRVSNSSVPSLTAPSSTSIQSSQPDATPSLSDEDLLHVPTPPDLCLADLTPPPDVQMKEFPSTPLTIVSPRPRKQGTAISPPSMFHRTGLPPSRTGVSTPSNGNTSLIRSATVPVPSRRANSPSRIGAPRTPVPRPPVSRNASTLTNSTTSTVNGVPATASRSKGVQMVSEMRARVRILEQKIHTRVPRLRMGSVTSRTTTNPMPPPPVPAKASASPAPSTASSKSASLDERFGTLPKSRKPSVDLDADTRRTPGGDSSGWVLVMEDTPSPVKDKDKERRRTSSPPSSAPTSFRPMSSVSIESPTSNGSNSRAGSALSQSVAPTGIRRPQSRLSTSTEGRSSTSTTATTSTTSSVHTPSSRPTTPTFLPVPSASLYGGSGIKRSTGPGSGAYGQSNGKRSSLGASTARSPSESPTFLSHSNVTLRPPKGSVLPAPNLGQSRIGKPSSGRRSAGGSDPMDAFFADPNITARRARAGSTTLMYSRNGG